MSDDKLLNNYDYLFFISSYNKPQTGANFRYERLIKFIASRRQNIIWIRGSGNKNRIKQKNINSIELFNPKRITQFSLPFKLFTHKKELKKYRGKKCLIIVFGETNLIASVLLKIYLKATLSIGVRSNVLKRKMFKIEESKPIKGFLKQKKLWLMLRLWKLIYRNSEHITVQTTRAKNEFSENFGINPNKVSVIENNLPRKFLELSTKKQISDPPKKILYIGNSHKVKGFDIILESALDMIDICPTIECFTCVGISSNDKEMLSEKLSNTNVFVYWYPWCDDVQKLMLNHDLLIVPSREDQFPNVVLEALAINLPVIGSSVDGIKYMLKDEWILFNQNNINSFLECFKRVSAPGGINKVLNINNKRKMNFKFNWEHEYYQAISDFFENE